MSAAVVPFHPRPRLPVVAPGPLRLKSRGERQAEGKALRDRVPREEHAKWAPALHRRDPVEMLMQSSGNRIPELVPIRYGRMLVSPFTFYRGTADVMAADLAPTPVTGLHAQICGDCHLLNMGGFATPERKLIFDINDFDETLPGSWEWDVKRLAASFVLACRANGFAAADQRTAAQACVRSYRQHMRQYAGMKALSVWYDNLEVDALIQTARDRETQARMRKRRQKESARTVAEHDFPKMAEQEGGGYVIKENPPLIYHHPQINVKTNRENIELAFARYRETLADDRRVLLDRYQLMDISLKVVGIGSVGTFCPIVLMLAGNDDPLFLQVKEAHRSVLEPYAGKSVYANHGERVVVGQRLMQSASDIFLGWTHGKAGRHFYIRQLRDVKLKILVEIFNETTMMDYAAACGWTLARAHARSGDPAMIAGYLGKSEVFDEAISRFSVAYANQAERDHSTFKSAIRKGKIAVEVER